MVVRPELTFPDRPEEYGAVTTRDEARSAWELFALTFAILFLEMAAIRWLNASIPVLSYFNNLILISCFLGLGVGCLLARRRITLLPYFPVAFLLFVIAVLYFNAHGFELSYTDDLVFVPNARFYEVGALEVSAAALLGSAINLALFTILGQELGRRLEAMNDPLRAYAWDIGGSLSGTLGYAAIAALGTPPWVWFALGTTLVLLLLRRRPKVLAGGAVAVVLAVLLMWNADIALAWSPYYKVEIAQYRSPENRHLGFMIRVDDFRIQDALNFGPDLGGSNLGVWIPYYELPYRFLKPKRVLILGAGSGNEAVMAAAQGAEEIHAVEIDPVIAGLGFGLHPNTPYRARSVHVRVEDARAFIASDRGSYDLIVMSALDSHKQIGGMASLRLESFVYTVESYRRIRELLAPGGVFCLNLGSTRPWVGERAYWSLTEAFGREPARFQSERSPFDSVAYVYGPEEVLRTDRNPDGPPIHRLPPLAAREGVRRATDNWPFLYLETNRIPKVVTVLLAGLVLASLVIVSSVERAVRRPNLHFLFLGAGFMLLETRSITQMALVFGATWNVNAIVIASVLLTILVANALVRAGRGLSSRAAYLLLFATLVLGYFFPFESLLRFGMAIRLLASLVLIGLPIFWAAFIFSNSFRRVAEPARAFGSNLLGVVIGGALEYTSNIWGLDVLYLLAALLYAGSLVLQEKEEVGLATGAIPLAGEAS